MRVLLVEDDPQLGDGLTIGLRQAGLTVDWIHDGILAEHALEYLPAYSPDLNPIEHKWAQAKDWRKRDHCSVKELFPPSTL